MELTSCLSELKTKIHMNYNDSCKINRGIGMNDRSAKRDLQGLRKEVFDEFQVAEMDRDRIIAENKQACLDREHDTYSRLEFTLREYVKKTSKEEQLIMKAWVRDVTNEVVQNNTNELRGYF